jgi:hypothetical protein
MPTLLELQRAMRAGLIDRNVAEIAGSLGEGYGADRLDIYSNTIMTGLTKALRLTFPAVERLVGGEFFDGAADTFIRKNLPGTACLDQYGGEFADFLRGFPLAASLSYLSDVAALEWLVSRALHAEDREPLELDRLTRIPPEEMSDLRFEPHPAIGLLHADHPADDIWRAVLASDGEALAALDVTAGPVFLLVERGANGVEVARLPEAEWRFLQALCRGEPLHAAIGSIADLDAANLLAGHLAAGRFVALHESSAATAAA